MILVSVIVITYNQESTISRTIDSILSQKTTYQYEIIIGEDGSIDKTRTICEQYANKYPNIKLLPKTKNKGSLLNYIDCTKQCIGKYIMGCAGDDWWHNINKMQMQIECLEQNPNCVLVYSDYNTYDIETKIVKNVKLHEPDNNNLFIQLLHGNYIPSLTVCYRREFLCFVDFNFLIERHCCIEDYPMWLTFSHYGNFYYLQENTATYSVDNKSISHSDRNKIKYLRDKFDIKIYFYEKYKPNISICTIKNPYYREMSFLFLQNNMRKEYSCALKNIQNKTSKEWIKYFLSKTKLSYNYLYQRTQNK